MRARTLLFVLVLGTMLGLAGTCYAATNVPASTIMVDTIWSASSSPYILGAGGVAVGSGVILTIEPGVVVKTFYGGITVAGTLDVKGTAVAPVVFTSLQDDTVGGDTNQDGDSTAPAPGDWRSINTTNTNSVINLEHADIRYGGQCHYTGCYALGSVENGNGTLTVSDSKISYSSSAGIATTYGGTTTITHTELAHNVYGNYLTRGTSQLSGCNIYNNSYYGVYNSTTATTTATYTYWGDPSGPYSASYNSSGAGDALYGKVDFKPWLDAPDGNPVIEGPRVSNVLFLPGIEASELYTTKLLGENRVWLPNSLVGGDAPYLDMADPSMDDGIYAKERGIVGAAYGVYDVYAPFVTQMNQMVATGTIAEWEPVAYDWRLDYEDLLTSGNDINGNIYYRGSNAATSTPYIVQELERLAATSKNTGKVTIIAHSNGGLLAKALLTHPEYAQYVDKLILVASPQLGTPQAIGALLHGFDQGLPAPFFQLFMSDADARYLAQSMPMAYNLLPSAAYLGSASVPVVSFDTATLSDWASKYGSSISTLSALGTFLSDASRPIPYNATFDYHDTAIPLVASSTLFTNAGQVHNELDNWTPPADIKVITIAGWGNATVSGIEYEKLPFTQCILGSAPGDCDIFTRLAYRPTFVVDGDGTVIDESAQWDKGGGAEKYWVNMRSFNADLAPVLPYSHANILATKPAQDLIESLLTNSTTTIPQYVTTDRPSYSGSDPRLFFVAHSPVTLGFTDSSGNYTGATASSVEFSIPSVDYQRFGEVQWLSVPKSMAGQVVMRGTGAGSFALDIQEQQGNTVVATTTFAAIPSATSTVATFAINPAVDPTASGTLEVDYDGDGQVDSSFEAKQGEMVLPVFDSTPPEAIIGFSTTTNAIEISGVDETSSTTVSSTATSTTITDQAGNWLTISTGGEKPGRGNGSHNDLPLPWAESPAFNWSRSVSRDFAQGNNWGAPDWQDLVPGNKFGLGHDFGPGTATLTIRSLSYSTGTTTSEAATLRYFWNTNKKGEYTTFISSIKTPTGHMIAIYIPSLDKTFIVAGSPKDDDEDLSTKAATLLIRKKIRAYNGLYIPNVRTERGIVIIK